MLNINDILMEPAVVQADLIKRGQVSCTALIDASLTRIKNLQPKLNMFSEVFYEDAMSRAWTADVELENGETLGCFHGLPVAFKDLTPIKDTRTTMGSYVYKDWYPDRNALIVDRLLDAGGILVGKTTTPEFAYSSFTNSPLLGKTRNPWNVNHTSGGSSGGSAVAVATGCVSVAEGSDMGGSVRIPSSFCGVVGLKPALGRIPFDIFPTTFENIAHFGPIARAVDDIDLFLSAAAGPSERDILSQGAYKSFGDGISKDINGLNIAYCLEFDDIFVDKEVRQLCATAIETLCSVGATAKKVNLDWSRSSYEAWLDYWAVFLAAVFGHHLYSWREKMDTDVVDLMERGFSLRAVDYKRIEFLRTQLWSKVALIFKDFDVLICPTMTRTAPNIDCREADFMCENDSGQFLGLDLTCQVNLLSQCPAVSLPVGIDSCGLPVGLQVIGQPYDEFTPLRVGKALANARGGLFRIPTIFDSHFATKGSEKSGY